MTQFLGMALYNKEEIQRALDNYSEIISKAKTIRRNAVDKAEKEWKPSKWDKFWRTKSLFEKYQSSDTWSFYSTWLYREGYLDNLFEDPEDLELIVNLSYRGLDLSYWGDEHSQVKDLFNGGKDCYLNPEQARFVNKFKNGGIEC